MLLFRSTYKREIGNSHNNNNNHKYSKQRKVTNNANLNGILNILCLDKTNLIIYFSHFRRVPATHQVVPVSTAVWQAHAGADLRSPVDAGLIVVVDDVAQGFHAVGGQRQHHTARHQCRLQYTLQQGEPMIRTGWRDSMKRNGQGAGGRKWHS